MFQVRSSYQWSVIGLMSVYSVLCFAVPEFFNSYEGRGLLAYMIGASPAYPIAVVLFLYIRQLGKLDELEQRIQLTALAIASGMILIGATAYGFVELHLETPSFPMVLILPTFILICCVAVMALKRGYR